MAGDGGHKTQRVAVRVCAEMKPHTSEVIFVHLPVCLATSGCPLVKYSVAKGGLIRGSRKSFQNSLSSYLKWVKK